MKQNPLKSKTKDSVLSSKVSTKEKSKDPVLRETIRTIASILVALSGIPLFSDKVFTFTLENNFGFEDTQTFLWVLTQSVSPLLLVLGANFKPYKLAYTIPVYLYAIQLYWVFDPDLYLDDPLLHIYALGCVVVFIFLVRLIHIKIYRAHIDRTYKTNSLENLLDLYISKQVNENKIATLKLQLDQANLQYDKGKMSKAELENILFDIHYEYKKLTDTNDDFLSFL